MDKRITNKSNLDYWVEHITSIYEECNGERDFKDVLIYFNEDVGRCFQLINRRKDEDLKMIIPSLFRWFCILYSKSNNKKNTVSDLLWNKFPGICPYCKKETCGCDIVKHKLDLNYISDKAGKYKEKKPITINEWQKLFQKIYPRKIDETDFIKNISHLSEELSELSEVHRLYYTKTDMPCVEMEIADVFSWIMGLANLMDQLSLSNDHRSRYKLGDDIESLFFDGCPYCKDLRQSLSKYQKIEKKCCCFLKKKELRLVSDYDDNFDDEDQKDESNIGTNNKSDDNLLF